MFNEVPQNSELYSPLNDRLPSYHAPPPPPPPLQKEINLILNIGSSKNLALKRIIKKFARALQDQNQINVFIIFCLDCRPSNYDKFCMRLQYFVEYIQDLKNKNIFNSIHLIIRGYYLSEMDLILKNIQDINCYVTDSIYKCLNDESIKSIIKKSNETNG